MNSYKMKFNRHTRRYEVWEACFNTRHLLDSLYDKKSAVNEIKVRHKHDKLINQLK